MVAHLVVEMRTVKSVLGWTLAMIVLAVIVWTSTYLYWHIRIVGALRTFESQASAEIEAAGDTLDEAGCRATPYLVSALDESRPPTFLTLASTALARVAAPPGDTMAQHMRSYERMQEWRIEQSDSAALRQKKCDLIRAWWRENGGRHHQTWRIWSSQCAK